MTESFDQGDPQIATLLRSFVEQAHEHALLLLDTNGIVRWCSPGAERVLAAPAAKILGRHVSVIFTDQDRAAGLDRLERVFASVDAIAEDDRWHVRLDGSRFWSSGTMVPIRDAAGELLGYGKIFRDRTDAKTQTELLENKFKAARELGKTTAQAVTKLAHELRNAIGGLRGGVDMLTTSLDDEERRTKFTRLMRSQLETLGRLTQDLLDVERAAGGKLNLQLEPLVLQAELRGLIEARESALQAKRMTLHLLTPEANVIVNADRVRLRQIFGNLLDNAIKYTPAEGTVWIKLTAEERDAVVQVEDTGRGIPAHMLESIFELFTQVDAHASMEGLGIGLALVRELALLHEGSVQAASKGPGEGSQFTVRLPLRAIELAPS